MTSFAVPMPGVNRTCGLPWMATMPLTASGDGYVSRATLMVATLPAHLVFGEERFTEMGWPGETVPVWPAFTQSSAWAMPRSRLMLEATMPVVALAVAPMKTGPAVMAVLQGFTVVPSWVATQVTWRVESAKETPVICMLMPAPRTTDWSWPSQMSPARSVRSPLWKPEMVAAEPVWQVEQAWPEVAVIWRWMRAAEPPTWVFGKASQFRWQDMQSS